MLREEFSSWSTTPCRSNFMLVSLVTAMCHRSLSPLLFCDLCDRSGEGGISLPNCGYVLVLCILVCCQFLCVSGCSFWLNSTSEDTDCCRSSSGLSVRIYSSWTGRRGRSVETEPGDLLFMPLRTENPLRVMSMRLRSASPDWRARRGWTLSETS